MSSIDAAHTAIVTRWKAQMTSIGIVDARRDFSAIGGAAFNRPQVPAVTNANRKTVGTGLVWVRLAIDGVGGSTRPLGIDPSCPTRSTGFVTQHVYYPLGYGMDFVLELVDSIRGVFHRQSLASGVVSMRDAYHAEFIEIPEDRSAGWGRVDCANPFWLTETV